MKVEHKLVLEYADKEIASLKESLSNEKIVDILSNNGFSEDQAATINDYVYEPLRDAIILVDATVKVFQEIQLDKSKS